MSSGSEEHITCIHRCPVVSVSVTEEQAQAFMPVLEAEALCRIDL